MNKQATIWHHLSAAPHRSLFLVGALQGVLTLLWWTLDLMGRYGVIGNAPVLSLAPIWAHAFLMVYGFFPFFIFGFLFTTFPNWMNGEKIKPRHYLATCMFMAGGVALFYAGLYLGKPILVAGIAVMLTGWGIAIMALLRVLLQTQAQDKRHAQVASVAFIFGWLGVAAYLVWLLTDLSLFLDFSRQAGIWFFLLPILLTVSHRMIPFFSSRVLENYVIVRPYALLWLMLACSAGHGLLQLMGMPQYVWWVDLPLAGCALYLSWAWGLLRSFSVSLLAVLHISFAWLTIAMLLFAAQSLMMWLNVGERIWFGLAPLHALVIGYFASMVLGMASRVTIGHSGRPLVLDHFTWLLFLGFQATALLRMLPDIIPAVSALAPMLYLLAAAVWLICFTLWAARFAPTYWRPRVDDKPG
ncbi:NnrS family protein [Nitrosomonas sp. Is37]|uniref:NnrS family protein n=1 Tax=Nitrosomonas sp. Is37 TaxID=3080535 RepID=UPI00294AB68E|nr:NnrS family protein [Nitrosomonas sp. Is37]MDV6343503.1 NnrS family protein [Nitrosomonas sp. Is37]